MGDKRVNIVFDAKVDLSNLKTSVQTMQDSFSKINLSKGLTTEINSTFKKINNEIQKLTEASNMEIKGPSDVNKITSSYKKVEALLKIINGYTDELNGKPIRSLISKDTIEKTSKATTELKKYYNAVNNTKIAIENKINSIKSYEKKLEDAKVQEESLKKSGAALAQQQVQASDKYNKLLNEQTNIKKQQQKLRDESGQKAYNKSEYTDLSASLEKVGAELKIAKQNLTSLNTQINNNNSSITSVTARISAWENKISELKTEIDNLSTSETHLNNLRQKLTEITSLDFSGKGIEEIKSAILNLPEQDLEKVSSAIKSIGTASEQTKEPIRNMGTTINQVSRSAETLKNARQEVEQLGQQVKYFFGLQNTINLFQRAVRSAFTTVQDLDEAMTETAVVTDFNVSDMWDKLPQYTRMAEDLGTTIKGAYETLTLYYQQGLDVNEATQIGTETMKMARIANLDNAKATDLMTAALRGFNMELDETSAQRVNDVYSELAAVTASDTNELASAMTRTASIAHSANMEFETTTAFLAQMIETTRESAENLGTAMKTIIARFTEMKSSPSKIFDVEGEEVNINKVDAALKSVGISLKDFFTGAKGLDEIFLELASKWDSLDIATQRYVATMAAGSRQQSRFIAMMDNYDRTMELVDAANNSAGASAVQFEKTMESMDAKLARLKDEWDRFAMGLANSDAIKFVVDALTNLLSVINNIADSLGDFGGGLFRVGTIIVGLKLGKKGFEAGLDWVGNFMDGVLKDKDKTEKTAKTLGDKFNSLIGKNTKPSKAQVSVMDDLGKISGLEGQISQASDKVKQSTLEYQQSAKLFQAARDELKNVVSEDDKFAIGNALGYLGSDKINKEEAVEQSVASLNNLYKERTNIFKNLGATQQGLNSIQKLGLDTNKQSLLYLNKDTAKISERISLNDELSDGSKRYFLNLIAENNQENVGIGIKARSYAALLLCNKTKRLAMMQSLGLASAEEVEAIAANGAASATSLLNAAIASMPVGWVLAGLAAIAGAIWWIADAIKKASIEYKIEQATQALKDSKEAANDAKTAYDDLQESFDNYNEIVKSLEDLTVGTSEWKDQLIKANEEVVKLLETYPQLAKYITTDKSGLLTLNEEGQNELLKEEGEKVSKLQTSTLVGSQYTELLKQQKDINEKESAAREKVYGLSDSGMTLEEGATFKEGYEKYNSLLEAIKKEAQASTDRSVEEQNLLKDSAAGLENTSTDVWNWVQANTKDLTINGVTYSANSIQAMLADLNKNIFSPLNDKIAAGGGSAATYKSVDGFADFEESRLAKEAKDQLNTSAIKTTMLQGISDALQNSGLSEGLANGLSQISGNLQEEVEKAKRDLDSVGGDDLKKKYADAFYGGDISKIASDMEEDAMRFQLASQQVGENYQKYINNAYEAISKMALTDQKEFIGILNRDTTLDYNKLDNFDTYLKKMDKSASELASEMGTTVEELTQAFEQAKTDIHTTQLRQKKQLFGTAIKATENDNTQKRLNSYSAVIQKLNAQQASSITNFENTLLKKFGEKGTTSVISTVFDGLSNKSDKYIKEYMDKFSSTLENVNWDSAIDGATAIKKGLASSNKEIRKVAKGMAEVGQVAYGVGAQMQEFFKASSFEDIQKDIVKTLKKGDKITASKVEEYAEESTELQNVLENTDIAAQTLADTLAAVGSGDLGIEDVTSGLLDLADSTQQLNNVVAESVDLLDNFDPGIDEGEVGDKVNDIVEKVANWLKEGAYGNTQLYNYLDLFFGEDFEKAANKDLEKATKFYGEKLKKLYNNLYGAWKDLATNSDYAQALKKEGLGVSLLSDGSIELQFGDFSTNEVVKKIAKAYNVTDEYAKMMLTDFKNYSGDVAQELRENDYTAGWSDFLKKSQYQISKISEPNTTELRTKPGSGSVEPYTPSDYRASTQSQTIINAKDLTNYGKLYGKDELTVWQDLAKELDININKLTTVEGIKKRIKESGEVKIFDLGSDDDIETQLKNVQSLMEEIWGKKNRGLDPFINGKASLDELVNTFSSLGVKDDLIYEAVEKQIDNLENKDGTIELKGYDLELTEVQEKGVTKTLEEAQTKADATIYAQAITDSFTTVDTSEAGTNIRNNIDQAILDCIEDAKLLNQILNGESPEVQGPPQQFGKVLSNTFGINLNKPPTFSTGKGWSFAQGTKKASVSSDALVGEEGPELSYNKKGEAKLLGAKGPEITKVNKDDVIFPADETKDILKNRHKKNLPSFADGRGTSYKKRPAQTSDHDASTKKSSTKKSSTKKSSSKKSSSSKEEEPWKNTYDWLYNLTADINAKLREREKLEKKYDRLLENRKSTAKDIYKNYKDQVKTLGEEIRLQQQMYVNRKQEIKDTVSWNSDLKKYAAYNWKDNTIEINWGNINRVTDNDLGDRIEEYISKLEELQDSMNDAEDAIDEYTDTLKELEEQGREDTMDFEQRVYDAILNREQKIIDNLSNLDETINNSNDALMSAIQENLDKIRQDRNNQKTEKEITDKERQLAYLQLDTSSSNELAIKQLQEELTNQEQDYTDNLIDQRLSEIEQQNEKASDQRQTQISIMQAQLDVAKNEGKYWNEVYTLINKGTTAAGALLKGSELEKLLKKEDTFSGLSSMQKMDWLDTLEQSAKISISTYAKDRQLEKLGYYGGQGITFTDGNGKQQTGVIQSDGSVRVKGKGGYTTYNDVFLMPDGRTFRTLETGGNWTKTSTSKKTNSTSSKKQGSNSNNKKYRVGSKIKVDPNTRIYANSSGQGGGHQYFDYDPNYIVLSEQNGYVLVRHHKTSGYTGWFKSSAIKSVPQYKKGGLADFTGPAWLDGTKSSPELILNAKDTQNFLTLKEVLSSVMKNNNNSIPSQSTGDVTVEVNINVDKIEKDYDVEQLAKQVKKSIASDARYRNVNAISFMR